MCTKKMGQIIYSNIQEKKCCVMFYNNKIYCAGKGAICVFLKNSEQILIEHDKKQNCLNAVIDDGKLYYFFEGFLDILENDMIHSYKYDFKNVDAIQIKKKILYYTKEGYLIKSNIGNSVYKTINLQNAVKPQIIKVLTDDIVLIGDSKGFLWLVDIAKNLKKQFKVHSDSIQDIWIETHNIVTVSRDKKIKRFSFNLKEMKIVQNQSSKEFEHFINCIVLQGKEYYLGLSNGLLLCVDEKFDIKMKSKVHIDAIRSVQQISDARWMTFSDDGIVCIIEQKNNKWKIVGKRGKLEDKIQCSCMLNNIIYLGFRSGMLKKVNPINGDKIDICKISNIRSMCCISNEVLACGAENGFIYFVWIKNGKTKIISKRGTTPYSLSFNILRSELFVGRRDGTIDSYYVCMTPDIEFSLNRSCRNHQSIVGDIIDKEDKLFTCSDDQSIKILDYDLNIISTMLSTAHNTAVNNLIVTAQNILASSDNGYIYRIDRENTDDKKAFSMFDIPIRAMCISEEEMLYIGDRQGNVFVWDFDKFAMGLYKGSSRVVNIYEICNQIIVIFEDAVIKLDLEVEKMRKKEKVFIIHGHNNELKREVQLLLERIGIEGIVLHERADKGRTVIDKLIEESEPAIYAIAILTPDDVIDSAFRARQNVYLETGYFLGKLGKSRVLLLKLGNIEIPSDLQGILYTEVDDVVNGYWKSKVVKELVGAGFNVDMSELIKII